MNPRQRLVADYAVMVLARQRRARALEAELRAREAEQAQALMQAQQAQQALQQAQQTLADYHQRLARRTVQAQSVRVDDLLGARTHCERLEAQTQAVQAQLQARHDQVQQAQTRCQEVRRRLLGNEERMRTLDRQRTQTLQALQREEMDHAEEEHADTLRVRADASGRPAWTS